MNKFFLSMGLLAAMSAVANAQPVIIEGSSLPSERVSFADLNIESQDGVRTLKARIRSAAGRICLSNQVEPLRARLNAMTCFRTAIGNAHGQMDRIVAERASGTSLVAMAITVSPTR